MKHRFVRDDRLDVAALTEELRGFLDLVVREMHLQLQYEISTPAAAEDQSPDVRVDFSGADQDLLLERHGELLLALEHLAVRWLGLELRFHDSIHFDSGDTRAIRLEELKLSARVAAQRVRETHQPFRFNPMPSGERRIIHLELTGAAGVRTESEGVGERRHLVIYPTEKK